MWVKGWWIEGLRCIERVIEQQNEKYISVDLVWIWLEWMVIFEPFAWICPCRRLVFCVDGMCSSADYDAIRRLLRAFWTNGRQGEIKTTASHETRQAANAPENRAKSRINTKKESRLAQRCVGRLFLCPFVVLFDEKMRLERQMGGQMGRQNKRKKRLKKRT